MSLDLCGADTIYTLKERLLYEHGIQGETDFRLKGKALDAGSFSFAKIPSLSTLQAVARIPVMITIKKLQPPAETCEQRYDVGLSLSSGTSGVTSGHILVSAKLAV